MSDLFERAFALTVGEEGGFDKTRSDPGNWSGGAVGMGLLRGTKFGVSAASYPTLDIEALTLAQARAIYLADFWQRVAGDSLPAGVAMLVFDAAVNQGVGAAARLLQLAAGVAADGVIGPATRRAVAAADATGLALEFAARRAVCYAETARFALFGLGWMRRLMAVTRAALAA
ncbi:MAG: hypothetical protein KGL55_09545 [Rhodospirillales bacterium]|nr:hypothetical protein [Rhodospirillales bacterium]MDE2575537.1 hypothetical protein [Rhodospirillales bacterium]